MPMQLVWLHGPPAAGKLTVAKALQSKHDFKLFHNHLAVDLSMAIYDAFGDKDFHHFTNSIRRQTLSKANDLGIERMVMTFMTCAQEDEKEIRRYLDFLNQKALRYTRFSYFPGMTYYSAVQCHQSDSKAIRSPARSNFPICCLSGSSFPLSTRMPYRSIILSGHPTTWLDRSLSICRFAENMYV